MAKAGTLSVWILARTSSFTKGMKQVKRQLSDVTRQAAAFAAVAVAAGAYMVRQQMEQIDTTGKLAERLRSSTEDIIALNKVTQEAGGSAEGMQKMLQFVAKAAGEAAGGSTEAKRVFEGIGISMDDLKSKSPVELMLSVSDALDRISNVNTRAAVAARLFGKQGVENLNTLTDLRSKLQEVMEHLEKTGLLFSALDAAKVEAANDAWGRVKDVLTGIATQTAIALADKILFISEAIYNAATEGEGFANSMDSVVEKITIGIGIAGDFFQAFKAGLSGVQAVIFTVADLILALTQSLIAPVLLLEKLYNLVAPSAIESKIGENVTLLLDSMREGFQQAKQDALDDMTDSAIKAGNRDAFFGVMEASNLAAANAEKAAQAVIDKVKQTTDGVSTDLDKIFGGGGDTTAKVPRANLDLFQGDISRFALGFEGRMKKDKNPQIDKTNEYLRQILGKIGGPNIAVAG